MEGCAPLTEQVKTQDSSVMILDLILQDMATVQGCSRKFSISKKAEWLPETYFPVNQEVSSFFVKFPGHGEVTSTEDDTAVIKLLDDKRSRDKMYTIKVR